MAKAKTDEKVEQKEPETRTAITTSGIKAYRDVTDKAGQRPTEKDKIIAIGGPARVRIVAMGGLTQASKTASVPPAEDEQKKPATTRSTGNKGKE